MKKKAILIFIYTVILIVLLNLVKEMYQQRSNTILQNQQNAASANARLEVLWMQYGNLQEEIEQLQNDLEEDCRQKPSVTVLCTTVENAVHDIISMTELYRYQGVLAVSEYCFPGDADCLTIEEVNALAADGWEICLKADGQTDLDALLSRVEASGLPTPTGFYYPDAEIPDSHKDAIHTLGNALCIVNGSETYTEDSFNQRLVPYIGSSSETANKQFYSLISQSGHMVYTVGFSEAAERYSEENFKSMLEVFYAYSSRNKVDVVGLSELSKRMTAYYFAITEHWAENEAIERKKKELDACEAEIQILFQQSNDK